MITVRSLPVHLMPSPVPSFLQGSYLHFPWSQAPSFIWLGFTNLSESMPVFPFLQATQIRFIEHRSRRENGKKNTKEQPQAKGAGAVQYAIISADKSLQETEGCSRMQLQYPCTCSALCSLFTFSCFVLRHRIIWKLQRSCPCTFHEGILTGGGERHSFLTSALNGGEWSASFFGRCASGEKPSITTE